MTVCNSADAARPQHHASKSPGLVETNAAREVSEHATPEQIVRDFLYDWRFGIIQAFETWVDPECVFENPGRPASHGMKEILDLLAGYIEISRMPFGIVNIIHILTRTNVVMMERLDTLYGEYDDELDLKLMSRFVVRGNKIVDYANYYNPAPFDV